MYIHEEIMKSVLPLIKKYDLELIDLIGEMNHAAWELTVLNQHGLVKLEAKLNEPPNVRVEPPRTVENESAALTRSART